MDARSFDTLTRRASLLTLGGAALAATLANADLAVAKRRRRKKAGKTCKKKERKRCNRDAAACRQAVALVCVLPPAQCALAQTCCDRCQAGGLLPCIAAASGSA